MAQTLTAGVRRTPQAAALDAVFAAEPPADLLNALRPLRPETRKN
jgi:hypothetical protein